ncbi:hypothetical protein L596_014025 [Steinernema carpocapsae]|uniref:Uncharacterized protein n=1 Tax=Steinernema carpocapsae TaxID=34508 RepID=A0A4U5NA55_STECR|nr:hypothetical protein L596_014025 [Steinernema carpocapsae]
MAEYKVLTANKFGFLCDDEAGDSEAEIKKAVMDNAAKQAAEKKKAAEEAVAAAEEKIAAEKALSAAKPVRKEGGCPARRGDRAGGRGGRGGRREDRAPRGGRREGGRPSRGGRGGARSGSPVALVEADFPELGSLEETA